MTDTLREHIDPSRIFVAPDGNDNRCIWYADVEHGLLVALLTKSDAKADGFESLAAVVALHHGRAWRDRVALDPDLCGLCKKPATGLASIGDTRYCHGDEDASPTCYEVACWRETGRVSSPMDMDAEPGRCTCGLPGCSDEPDTANERTFTRESEAARCGCGNPDAHDYAPSSVPAGSDTADEPVCTCESSPPEFGGPIPDHDCSIHAPIPSSAPKDERETLTADALAADIRRLDGNHDLGAAILAEKLVAAGWRSPTEVTALVAHAREQVAGRLTAAEREIIENAWAVSPDDGPSGVDDPMYVAVERIIAARAATKAAS